MSNTTDTLAGTYAIDPAHSRLGFTVRHAMVTKIHGSFSDYEGSGYFDPDDPSKSSVSLSIRATSIDTQSADRDAHLRADDFFDMDNYPFIKFVSTMVKKLDENRYMVTGDLTIKDVTKPIDIEFEYTGHAVDPYQNHRIGLEGSASVNRKDWGIVWNTALETGGVLVSEIVNLEIEVSAIRKQ